MRGSPSVWLLALAGAAGCALGPSITVHGDASVRYRAAGLRGVDTVALLPPELDASLEPHRDTLAVWLLGGLNRLHPGLRFWPVDTAVARLAAADRLDAYARLVDHRREARGALDSTALAAVAHGAGTRWLLYADADHTDADRDERWLAIQYELWDGSAGSLVWQARAECRTDAAVHDAGDRRRQIEALLAHCLRDLNRLFLAPPRSPTR